MIRPHQPGNGREPLPQFATVFTGLPELVSPEFAATAAEVTELMACFVESAGQTEAVPGIVQIGDAREARAEAERDYFMATLGARLERDVDGEMTAAEVNWRRTGGTAPVVPKWVMEQLRMRSDTGEASPRVTDAVKRRVLLGSDDMGADYFLLEWEVPTAIQGSTLPGWSRIICLTNTPPPIEG